MDESENVWDAEAAADYDTPDEGMFAPEVLGPAVDRLAELDLMAHIAGFALESRHADWRGGAFVAESPSHVSVYRLPTAR
ncbi:hypothetical protein [Nocardiopsis sp. JB363]|uniref:hypothetical protein n=1 Tax=Nocardiopsis sp. JB363 TaxID=1434837 RepID=UPI00097B0B36|nr:hypothetical protein [Nocardiopsis sp. JB363]SIO88655.1 Methyltransferase SCO0408 [Nocardiopsis sp. JB363]